MQMNIAANKAHNRSIPILNDAERINFPRYIVLANYIVVMRWRLVIGFRYTLAKLAPLMKRSLDLAIVVMASLTMMPIIILTALAVKLDSSGPIFFKQIRVGDGGKRFTCYKFRSMAVDAEVRKATLLEHNEADGPVFKMQNDPRITRVGRVIRKFSIDELPQLYNVVRGEMSLVGPRPSLPAEVQEYKLNQLQRLDAVPGLTGLQQVSGRSSLGWEEWIHFDLLYIKQHSFWHDLCILFKTVPVVLFGRGAY